MRVLSITAVILLFGSSLIRADSQAPPQPLVFTSEGGGSALFTMVPAKLDADYKVTKKPFGIAYKLSEEGVLEELYRTSGWYSFRVFVSDDGKYLVQMGPWNAGHRPEKDHLAVAFYKNGKLLKSYSTADLVQDPDKVMASASHYMWLAPHYNLKLSAGEAYSLRPRLDYDNKFTLNTIDGWTYEFDATNGKIASTKKTKKAN